MLRLFEKVPPKNRLGSLWQLLVGAALCRQGQFSAAKPFLERVVKSDPSATDAYTWLALISSNEKDQGRSLEYAQKGINLDPANATCYSVLGQVYLRSHQPQLALEPLQTACKLEPKAAIHQHNFGQCLLELQRNDEAMEQFRSAIRLAPTEPQSYLSLASALAMFGFAGDAITCMLDAIRKCPRNAQLHSALASYYTQLRNDDEAEYQHQQAIAIDERSATGFGAWLVNQGRFDEATKVFRDELQKSNDVAFCFYNLMLMKKLKGSPEDLAFFDQMLDRLKVEEGKRARMYLSYALGRGAEQLGMYDLAAEHFQSANELAFSLHKQGSEIPRDRFQKEIEAQIDTFEKLKSHSSLDGHPSADPIFIVGMIRSGTTLLDQILSSHSQVESGGELRFWIEEGKKLEMRVRSGSPHHLEHLAREYLRYAKLLAGSEHHFSDKMPLNYAHVGAIHLALPNAKFIHIHRDPVDVCLSIWTTYFGQGPAFGYDKSRIVEAYKAYQVAVNYWRKAIPSDRFLEVGYEELIDNPEPVIRHIVSFLELEWEDSCLHHDQNSSAINTPSRWQARQPIYRTSVERWRNYEPWLGEFASLLQPLDNSSSA